MESGFGWYWGIRFRVWGFVWNMVLGYIMLGICKDSKGKSPLMRLKSCPYTT